MTEQLCFKFVRRMPKVLKEGILYISIEFRLVEHLCACGCGNIVVTPLDPNNGWTLMYTGESVSLSPSIGNYGFPCLSHYFIRKNRVVLCKSSSILGKSYRTKRRRKKLKRHEISD